MNYRIDISRVAEADADQAFRQLAQRTSPDYAKQWYNGLLHAIDSLSQMPKRCTFARENSYFSQDIRQLLYGRERNAYRILFTVLETENSGIVRSLHIRHAYQQTIGEKPDTDG